MASSRIQRWALTLGAYKYTIRHIPGSKMAHADGLSHLPLPHKPSSVPVPEDLILLTNHLSEGIITTNHIKAWTDKDTVLSRVRRLVEVGWTFSDPGPDFILYFNRHRELSVLDHGCVLWESHVVIPPTGHDIILNQLREAHPGVSRMKRLAHCFVWWPGSDSAIENIVCSCEKCQTNRPLPPKAPLHPWEYPSRPWTHLHIDHAGPFLGHTFLIVVDAHSKWIESHVVNSTSSEATIKVLRNLFATHGIPEHVVLDNGSGFTSQEFKQFMEQSGIKHTITSPYNLSSNSLAERAVQTVNHGISKLEGTIMSVGLLVFYSITV